MTSPVLLPVEASTDAFTVLRPPAPRMMPIPEPEPPPPNSMPVTSPERPWDRINIYVDATKPAHWTEDEPTLHDPLPENTPNGAQFIGPILINAIEILNGHRPPGTLRHWLDHDVYNSLARRAGLAFRLHGQAPRNGRPRILHGLKSIPLPRVIEAVASIHDGTRVRAACLRMEFIHNRWKVVRLEIG